MPPLLASQMKLGAPDGAAEAPPPGFGADLAARAERYVDEDPDGVTYRRYRGYEPIIEALRDKGVADSAMQSRADVWGIGVPGTESWDYRKVYDLARRHGVGDLKKDRAEFEAGIAARPGSIQRRGAIERSGRWWLELPLGVVQSFQPEYGPLPALGLPSKTILGAAAREAAINTLFEGVEIARTKEARDILGNPITVEEGATRLGMAAGAGALFGGGVRALPGGIDAARGRFEKLIADNWDKLPAGLRERWGSAAKVDGTALPDIFEAIVGRGNMSLDEKGAVALLRREAELDALNPFRPDGAGIEAHNAAVARNVERIAAEIQGMRAPRSVAAAAGDSTAIASGTVAPTSGGRAALKAKIGRAESPSDVAKNPRSSATGRYQFVRDTWLSYYKRRYGSQGLTDAQILAKRTDGNVQEVLMDDLLADNARFLQGEGQPETAGNLYLTHFAGQGGARKLFRADPNARAIDVLGAEVVRANPFLADMTARDVIAWAARKMDEAPSAVGGVGRGSGDAIDPEASVRADLQARTMQLEADRAALDAEAAARAVDDDVAIEAGRIASEADDAPAPGPTLRRDMFPDDDSWRIAQAAVDAEARGAPMPSIVNAANGERSAAFADFEPNAVGSAVLESRLFSSIDDAVSDPTGRQVLDFARLDSELSLQAPSRFYSEAQRPEPANLARIDEILAARVPSEPVPLAPEGARYLDDLVSPSTGYFSPADGRLVEAVARRIGAAVDAPKITRAHLAEAAAYVQPVRQWRARRDELIDAGGLTAAERASLDYDEPGLRDFVDPAGEGNRLDLDGSVHDLRAAIDAEDPLSGVAFATRDGIDETAADALAAIEAEEAALAALRACL